MTVGDALVIDPARSVLSLDLSAVYLSDFREHPVTTGLSGMAVLFPVTRPLEASPGSGWVADPLVETSDEGWGETNLRQLLDGQPVDKDDGDIDGPVAVVMAVTPEAATDDGDTTDADGAGAPGEAGGASGSGARMVVLGDSDFLTDGQIVNLGNLTLGLNSIRWLVAREQALGIPPREVGQTSMLLSADQLRLVFLLTVVVLPAASIVLGIVVWRRRRR